MMKLFGAKKEESTGEWGEMHNEEVIMFSPG